MLPVRLRSALSTRMDSRMRMARKMKKLFFRVKRLLVCAASAEMSECRRGPAHFRPVMGMWCAYIHLCTTDYCNASLQACVTHVEGEARLGIVADAMTGFRQSKVRSLRFIHAADI